MKTVLIISHRLGIGGTEKTIHYLSKYLLDHEWIVHVFCIGPKLEHPAMFFDPRITIINSNYQARCSPQLFLLISDLIRNIRSIKPDILLSFLSIPSILTIISNLFFISLILLRKETTRYFYLDKAGIGSFYVTCFTLD